MVIAPFRQNIAISSLIITHRLLINPDYMPQDFDEISAQNNNNTCTWATHIPPSKYPQVESNDKQRKMIGCYINRRFSRVPFSSGIIYFNIRIFELFSHQLKFGTVQGIY